MKKVILTLVAVATMGIANAQLFVGGNLGFGMQSGTNEVTNGGTTVTTDAPKTTAWEVTPKIGFQMDKMAFGVAFGINGNKEVSKEGLDDAQVTTTEKYFGWEVCPFFRYNAFEFGNFALFCELQVPFAGGKNTDKIEGNGTTVETDGAKLFSVGVQVVPGLSYKLSDHVGLDLYVDLLALGFRMDKSTLERDNYKSIEKETNLWAGINSLPQAITLGFNYNF